MATKKNKTKAISRQQRKRVGAAAAKFVEALGYGIQGELKHTSKRVSELWLDHLLVGERLDPARALGKGSPSTSREPVCVSQIGVHLVCPHHLTVAFGEAHVAYLPAGRLVGFGAMTRLVQSCTARLVLQEDATLAIADALIEHLGAQASVVAIRAVHPCHNIVHPRSHRAKALTYARRGRPQGIKVLDPLVRLALRDKTEGKPT